MHLTNPLARESSGTPASSAAWRPGPIAGFGVESYRLALRARRRPRLGAAATRGLSGTAAPPVAWERIPGERPMASACPQGTRRGHAQGSDDVASTNDLKNGLVLNLDGQLWSVVEFQHVKPGKGAAFVRTKLKNVLSGKVVDKTFNAGTKVETATVDKRDMQYLYKDGTDFIFMDSSTYDQIPVAEVTVGDAAALPAGEPDRHRRAARGRAAVRRAADLGHPRDHLHRARPAGRPLDGRHQAGDPRDRLRHPGAAVPGDRHQGQGRHPHRGLPRPSQLTRAQADADASPDQGPQARPRRALRGRAARPGPARSCSSSGPAEADPPVPPYAAELVRGVVAHRERLDELISTYTESWPLERMPSVDRAVLRLGAYELLFVDDVPDARRAQRGGRRWRGSCRPTTRPQFVNGLLARLLSLKPTLSL